MLTPTRRAAIVGRGGRFWAGRRLQVVDGALGGAVDGDRAGIRLNQMPQSPGSRRESVRLASDPSKASFAMRGHERAIAREGFDAAPFVGACDAR